MARLIASRVIVRLTAKGLWRVLNGSVGQEFFVDAFTDDQYGGQVAHVLDPRYPDRLSRAGCAIWSIGADGYEVVFIAPSSQEIC